MTQFSAIWVRCPKCYYSLLIDGAIFNNFLNDQFEIRHCKCGKDLTKRVKENIEDFCLFKKIYSKLYYSKKDNEDLNLLYDLYTKVVIA